MAEVIRMPRMSDTMTEGVFVEWHKKIGDKVSAGDIMAEVETDKATMDLESYQDGTLLYIGVEKGNAAPVDSIVAILGKKGEDIQAILDAETETNSATQAAESVDATADKPAPGPVKPAVHTMPVAVMDPPSVATAHSGVRNGTSRHEERIKASPLARKMAADHGYELRAIAGTGDGGRIIKRDIENYKPSEATEVPSIPVFVGQEGYEDVAVSQMRKTIARRLAESKFSAPHFYLTIDLDMDRAVEARKRINETAPVKISFNDLIVKAAALALRHNPQVNASWLEDRVRFNKHIHIGVAVAVDEGLLVPVIRFADGKSLSHISIETRDLAERARNKKLQPQDWEGNTFTISNLGMFGIEEFTAIINPPDSAIMAVGAIRQIPVVDNGEIRIGSRMKVTMSCDHRIVDGVVGSKFLASFKSLIEDPVRMLI